MHKIPRILIHVNYESHNLCDIRGTFNPKYVSVTSKHNISGSFESVWAFLYNLGHCFCLFTSLKLPGDTLVKMYNHYQPYFLWPINASHYLSHTKLMFLLR